MLTIVKKKIHFLSHDTMIVYLYVVTAKKISR